MSRSLLLALLLAATFTPVKLYAQTQDGQSSYGGFLYGNESEEDKEKQDQGVWQYSSRYKKAPAAGDTVENLLPQGEQYIYFVRKEGTKSNEAVLRMVSPVSLNGCVNILPPAVTVRRGGGMLAFKVESGAVALDKSVRYAHFQCHQGSANASADIVLDRDEIVSKHIKSITFQVGRGSTDTYEVSMNGNTLTLYPKTTMGFKPFTGSERADPLSYTFYPDNLVILSASGAPKNADLSEAIVKLAQSKGLTETSGLKTATTDYFIDQSGLIAGSLAFGAQAYVGTITAPETFQGPGGTYQRDKQVDVYARRPAFAD